MAIPGLNVGIPSGASVVSFMFWIFIFLIIAILLGVFLIVILMSKDQKKIVEIDMSNKRMRIFNGRMRNNRNKGTKQFWASKIKRFLPKIPGDSSFIKGKNDAYILLKDKNGMYHTVEIPTYEELKRWYKTQYDLDLDTGFEEQDKEIKQSRFKSIFSKKNNSEIYQTNLKSIYLRPSPHEDLDWLSSQIVEADKEFKINHWWQSPTVMFIGSLFICFITWVATIIIAK